MINYYHRFVPHLAAVLAPLHGLTASAKTPKTPLSWTPDLDKAFVDAKASPAGFVRLAHPSSDPLMPFSLTTDASDVAVGAVLSQGKEDKPLAFFSKKLSAAERKYSTFDRELLAIFLSIKHFRHMLEGRNFCVWTDHKPLCGALASSVERSPRQTRHLSFVAEFTSDIRHVAGTSNVVADTLSREVCSLSLASDLDLRQMAQDQRNVYKDEMDAYLGGKLAVRSFPLPCGTPILCDASLSRPRPLVPLAWTGRIFKHFHDLAHPGSKASVRLISPRFVWRGMAKNIRQMSRNCSACHMSKVVRHIRAPLEPLPVPDERFSVLHVDLVGPLPVSEGHTYLFSVIDLYTRWTEAIPLVSMTAEDCARALFRHWIAKFGVPSQVVSDQGRQFESHLWRELNSLLGIRQVRTTSYHPQSNGIIERFHRTVKERLMARSAGARWMEHLPLVFLGLRTTPREDSGCSPADLVFGTALRLPGEFLSPSSSGITPVTDFVKSLQETFKNHSPMPVLHHKSKTSNTDYLPRDLASARFVFVRVDCVRRPLTRPYEGPYPVVRTGPKVFTVLKNLKEWNVSVDRLKLAPTPLDYDPQRSPQPIPLPVADSRQLVGPLHAEPVPPAADLSPQTSDLSPRTADSGLGTVVSGESSSVLVPRRSGRTSRPPPRFGQD